MPIWLIPTIVQQPKATLIAWAAHEVQLPGRDGPTIHLIGYILSEGSGRVTSPVEKLDAHTSSVVTASGRVYRLAGPPGHNSAADYVWMRWQDMCRATVLREVTQELHQQFEAAKAADA